MKYFFLTKFNFRRFGITIKTKKESFGGAKIAKINPMGNQYPKVINVRLSFEEALKLNLAIDECLRHLNTYNRLLMLVRIKV